MLLSTAVKTPLVIDPEDDPFLPFVCPCIKDRLKHYLSVNVANFLCLKDLFSKQFVVIDCATLSTMTTQKKLHHHKLSALYCNSLLSSQPFYASSVDNLLLTLLQEGCLQFSNRTRGYLFPRYFKTRT